ncbi:MAG: hypothetical protein JWO46_445, partial [Nocardioidaceae bacterium]|nr:hypothetical protein [Nocardioidaceae bacterium]
AAVVSDSAVLLAGVALATTVLSGLFAVMVTRPASGVLATVREVAIAVGTAAIGALAVSAYEPGVDPARFRWVALVAALLAVLVLVDGLGAGLHGLGRRGLFLMIGGAVFLLAAVAYGEALTRWGSPSIVHFIADTRTMLVDHVGAVPHPVPALLGVPALAWGVFMRARRRQGWWACAFGVAATTATAAALVDPTVTLHRAGLGEALSLLVGLLLGYAVIRLDLFVTGPRGRRARQDEEAHALRPEPGRTRALR